MNKIKGDFLVYVVIFVVIALLYFSNVNVLDITGKATFVENDDCATDQTNFPGSVPEDYIIYKLFDSVAPGEVGPGAPYNSHVALWNELDPIYNVNICSNVPVSHTCSVGVDENSKQVVFWLFDTKNSHASQNNQLGVNTTPYTIPVCYNNKYCVYGNFQSDCSDVPNVNNYECVGSMSDGFNAHVGGCGEFGTKICCGDTDPDVPPCSFIGAQWTDSNGVAITSALVGDTVCLEVTGSNCDTKLVDFEVWENDFLAGEDLTDDPVNNPPDPSQTVFVSGSASIEWIAEWQEDCVGGACNPPEYYFKAILNEDVSVTIISGDLEVLEPDCGNDIREGSEECDGIDFIGSNLCIDFNSDLYEGGILGCFDSGSVNECTIDTSSCIPRFCKPVQVTSDIGSKHFPDIFGDIIVWEAGPGTNRDIYMNDTSTGIITQITSEPNNQKAPAIYGNKIVWENYSSLTDSSIVIYDIDSDTTVAIPGTDDAKPDIHGDRVVFVRQDVGPLDIGDIYIYDIFNEVVISIDTDPSWQNNPAIYGDIVVYESSKNGPRHIFMYDISSGIETEIFPGDLSNTPGIYGDVIVWKFNSEIYMYKISSEIVTQLTTDGLAKFSPDIYGNIVVWNEQIGGNRDIFMNDIVVGIEKNLFEDPELQSQGKLFQNVLVWREQVETRFEILMCKLEYCGNNVIDPREICDGTDLGISDQCRDFNLDYTSGVLACNQDCDGFDVSDCATELVECNICDDCGWELFGIGCEQNICVNFCPGIGSCHYPGVVGNYCDSCSSVIKCGAYTNPADCNGDVCGLLVYENRVGDEFGLRCKWENDVCVPDTTCKWNCEGIYGDCQGDGFKWKDQGSRTSCDLIGVCGDGVTECVVGGPLCAADLSICKTAVSDANCEDPFGNYPEKLACGLLEKNFPVFTLFNLIISLVLLGGYYTIRKFKN